MDSLAEFLDSRSDRTAIDHPARSSQPISLGQFSRTAYKTGNYLRHLGVGPGATVAIADDLAPEPLYALFGAALLGATARFDAADDDWRVLVGPTAEVGDRPTPPGSTRIGYGDRPADPAIAHFGTNVWSENPTFPHSDVGREDSLLLTDGEPWTHGELLDAAQEIVERGDVTNEDVMAVRAPLSNPGTVAAGIVAPLLVGATILLPTLDAVGTVAVASGDGDVPESRVVGTDDPRSSANSR